MSETPAPHGGSTPVGGDLTRVPWGAVAAYSAIAIGLGWLVCLPLWFGGGLRDPLFMPLALALMFTPSVAALIVTFCILKPRHKARFLGLTPFKPVWRSILVILAWPLVWLVVGFGGFWLAVAAGLVAPDLELTAINENLPAGLTLEMIVVLTFVGLPINVIVSSIPAFGEELGWRGFLVPALAPLGFWNMSLISGVIWGVWHAPLILLGYNFGRTDATGILWMVGFTIMVGFFLNIARLWCRNVYVAAIGHGALNAALPVSLLWMPTTPIPDAALTTALGLPGWIVMAALLGICVAVGLTGRNLPKPLVTAPAPGLDDEPQVYAQQRAQATEQ